MEKETERYLNSGIKGRFCENCENGFANGDTMFCPNDKGDDPIIRGKIFCDMDCADAYFDRMKPKTDY